MTDLILLDTHVHIYDCFDTNVFFSKAYDNFSVIAERKFGKQSFSGVLMLTETSKDHCFEKFVSQTEGNRAGPDARWRFTKTLEPCALVARSGDRKLYLIAGRQVVTAEDLEVLALISRKTYADGQPIDAVLDLVQAQGGIPVIPWGTGKWLGRRGEILNRLLEDRSGDFLLGDNSGRPIFWRLPDHFKKAKANNIRILPGSDPLPFPEEVGRAGSFGAAFAANLDGQRPTLAIQEIVNVSDGDFFPYGDLERPWRFIKNQIAMQMVKRRRKQGAR